MSFTLAKSHMSSPEQVQSGLTRGMQRYSSMSRAEPGLLWLTLSWLGAGQPHVMTFSHSERMVSLTSVDQNMLASAFSQFINITIKRFTQRTMKRFL
jgi:hypothetical protein